MRAIVLAFVMTALLGVTATGNAQASARRPTVIPAQELAPALQSLIRERKFQVVYASELLAHRRTQGVSGELTLDEALNQLLAGTGLTYQYVDNNTVAIREKSEPAADAKRIETLRLSQALATSVDENVTQQRKSAEAPREVKETSSQGIPEVLVQGSKLLNMDIARDRDGTLPYVIFDREVIEKSNAVNLEDFLKQRLTMNTQGMTFAQSANQIGTSQINLRGLGADQTLILIDGRRTSGSWANGIPLQMDLNGIPLAAIERVEVLPTTASGIYGGNATGGVINIIMRRDYAGVETKFTYDNTFDSDSAQRRMDLAAGLNLEGGRTNILVAMSYSDQNSLTVSERDFVSKARERILANNGGSYSALEYFGYPPLASTPNILSRNGSNLTLKSTGAALNSRITFVPSGYLGPASDGGAALVANAGRYNVELAPTAQSQAFGGGNAGMYRTPTVKTFSATLRREFTSRIQAFVEGSSSENTGYYRSSGVSGRFTLLSTSPRNPFNQDIVVVAPIGGGDSHTISMNDNVRVATGVIVKLPREWLMEADYTWTRTKWDYYTPPFSSGIGAAVTAGTLDVLRDTVAQPLDVSQYIIPDFYSTSPFNANLRDATLRFSGPLASLPTGRVTFSGLLEHRTQQFDDTGIYQLGTTLTIIGRSQTVDSAYMEVLVPLLAARQESNRPRLELQLAGRFDDYTTRGGTLAVTSPSDPVLRATNKVTSTNPTVGVRFQPLEDLTLRASYGTGFKPPSVTQLARSQNGLLGSGPTDPKRGNTVATNYIQYFGGNPELQPEESESWSAGAIFTPRFVPGLRMSLDYTRIKKTDNIADLTPQVVLDNEDRLPGRVTRGANLPGDQPGWAGVATVIDFSSANISSAELEAFDLQLDYQFQLPKGTLDFFALSTWQPHYKTQVVPTAPVIEQVGLTSSNPLEFKANGGVTWNYQSWSVGWSARYFDTYLIADPTQPSSAPVFIAQGSRNVPSQIYHDLFASYQFPSTFAVGVLAASEIQVGIKNVFNKTPPFALTTQDSATYLSPFGDPRLASYSVSIKKAF